MNSTRPRTSAKMATATTSWTILSVSVMSSPPDRRGRERAAALLGRGPAPGPGFLLGPGLLDEGERVGRALPRDPVGHGLPLRRRAHGRRHQVRPVEAEALRG